MAITGATSLTAFDALLNGVVAAAGARVQISSTSVSSGTLVANTSTPVPITFGTAFASAPVVIPILRGTPVSGTRSISVGSTSTTGASINVINTSGTGAVSFDWIAVGP